MNKVLLTLLLLPTIGFSQLAPEKYWVQFKDKAGSSFDVNQPNQFLSQRAIDRRNRYNIQVVESDLPVNGQYVNQVESAGNVSVLYTLKWLNGVVIQSTDTAALDAIWNLPFVDKAKSVTQISFKSGKRDTPVPDKFNNEYTRLSDIKREFVSTKTSSTFDYGNGNDQAKQIHVHTLHEKNFTGQNMLVAVMDAGFNGVDTINVFSDLRSENRLKDTWDFVQNGPMQFNQSSHGVMVLSTMAAKSEGYMVGTAPDATYMLFRTEDTGTEYLIEEYNWVAAAEYADSAGVDVFNTSLGYTTFDNAKQNHTYQDMDGNTTPITIGADMAASKGIIPVTSAGNSGSNRWRYISAPADGDSVFSIGAVRPNGLISSFSSRGPSSDGRLKPNVCATGAPGAAVNGSNIALSANGTSFAGPIMAGAVTCLWQALPQKNNWEIMKLIEQSANYSANPNNDYGNGIPNFGLAYDLHNSAQVIENTEVTVFPNPASLSLNISSNHSSAIDVSIVDIRGSEVWSKNIGNNEILDVSNWKKGIYFIRLKSKNEESIQKLVIE